MINAKTKDIIAATQALEKGDVVAIPTETVYGLAARIDRPEGLKKIFSVKQRPFFDPLIVHVHSIAQAQSLTTDWSPMADFLAKNFWPGPLTLILPKSDKIDPIITSGLDSVGLRCPRHPVALELLKTIDVPLAAPSANKFGKTSPTTSEHVQKEFPNENVLVLEGGPSEVGIESTVLKIDRSKSDYVLMILRKGLITQKKIEEKLQSSKFIFSFQIPTDKKASPGHLEHHYMPEIPVVYCSQDFSHDQILETLRKKSLLGSSQGPLADLDLGPEARWAARTLYSELRRLAESGAQAIVFKERAENSTEEWHAVLDRLQRAATLKLP